MNAGDRLGPYEIVAALGAGGMGEVYRARDTRLGRDVAIKVLPVALAADPDRLRRFEQEARAVAALNHPNVLVVYDVGRHEGSPYLVEELIEGESLRERLRSGPLPPRKAVELAMQACAGLAAAHEAGIVHRDLKPENLFVTPDSRLKVLDFGLAKLAARHEEGLAVATAAETEPGLVMGTVAYMSPEQVRGLPVDHRSDIFSLGAVLYEMVTGRQAFARGTAADTMSAILKEEPPELGSTAVLVPPALERVVLHCLEKSPLERFQSVRDLGFALVSASGAASVPVQAAGGPEAVRRPRHGPRVAGAVLLAVAAAAPKAGIGFITGRRVADRAPGARVTYQRLTVRRGQVGCARFSPDGKTVFYSAEWDTNAPEVFEVRPGFPTARAMGLKEAYLLAVSSRGVMAVEVPLAGSSAGTLAEVPISGGMPRSVIDRVWSADWSPDGSALAIAHLAGGKIRLEMPAGKVLYELQGMLNSVRVSPSGSYVAFVEWPVFPDVRGSVVIIDLTGRVRARTREWNSLQSVAWSADGREVWFCSSQDTASYELRALAPAGRERVVERLPVEVRIEDVARSGQILLVRTHRQIGVRGRPSPAENERELGWLDYSAPFAISRDGRTLLFDEQGIGGGPLYAVCLRGMDGSPAVRLGEGHGCALSPDGRWALAIHYGPPPRLLLLPTGAGEPVSLPAGPIDTYYDARLLPDGESVLFTGSEAGHDRRIFVQDIHGGLPRPITPEGVSGVEVSPDGRFVAGGSFGKREIDIFPIAGGEPQRGGERQPGESVFGWSADSRGLFVGRVGAELNVDRIDIDTWQRTPWRTFSIPDPVGVRIWNLILTPDGRSYAYGYARHLDDLYLVDGLK
jgi:WD40 repeat protein